MKVLVYGDSNTLLWMHDTKQPAEAAPAKNRQRYADIAAALAEALAKARTQAGPPPMNLVHMRDFGRP